MQPSSEPAARPSPQPSEEPEPHWLDIGVKQRTRYESLDNQFRASGSGESHLIALRTLVTATADLDPWSVTAEMMDSRQYGAPDDTSLNNGIVDAFELLQAYVSRSSKDVFSAGDSLSWKLGRQTLDVGSRRLVARNRFRNTINAFTGMSAEWKDASDRSIRAFAFAPVWREPRDQASLQDNDIQLDHEQDETIFAGIHASGPYSEGKASAEVYALLLDEDDEVGISTRNRELLTLGARLRKQPQAGQLDYEWESALQVGDSRASTSGSDTADLDHRAHFHHLSVGYRFPGEKKTQVEALFDYASGDDDPGDGENNRFDTLYGARRFEFGPTGIFGAFARANIFSPGVRVKFDASPETQVMLAHRLHYLASDRDAWTTSGLVDPTGATDDFIGQLAEVRVRHDLGGGVRLEGGLAHLFAGDFIDDAPNATTQGDATYVYFGFDLTL